MLELAKSRLPLRSISSVVIVTSITGKASPKISSTVSIPPPIQVAKLPSSKSSIATEFQVNPLLAWVKLLAIPKVSAPTVRSPEKSKLVPPLLALTDVNVALPMEISGKKLPTLNKLVKLISFCNDIEKSLLPEYVKETMSEVPAKSTPPKESLERVRLSAPKLSKRSLASWNPPPNSDAKLAKEKSSRLTCSQSSLFASSIKVLPIPKLSFPRVISPLNS